jgi:hypothetical protein
MTAASRGTKKLVKWSVGIRREALVGLAGERGVQRGLLVA